MGHKPVGETLGCILFIVYERGSLPQFINETGEQ